MRAPIAAHRDHAQIVESGHSWLWHLDLHLERDARARIGPVIRRDEPAGRSCRSEGASHLIDRDPKLTGHLTVHVDLNRGVVERLAVLEIAKGRNPAKLLPDLGGERPA